MILVYFSQLALLDETYETCCALMIGSVASLKKTVGKVAFLPGSADSDDEDQRFSGHIF